MALNSQGKCNGCGGIVKNLDGKRYTIENLVEIHNPTCAGNPRRVTKADAAKSEMSDAAAELKEAIA